MTCDNLLLLNLNHIGDILFTTPAIRALKEKYPHAHVTAVTLAGMEDLLRNNPCVDEVLTRRRGIMDVLKLRSRVRGRKNHVSVLFSFSSFQLAALGWLSGAGMRIGFDDQEVSKLLTHRVHRNQSIHRVDSFLDLARAAGAEAHDPMMQMFLGDDDRRFAAGLFESVGISGQRPVAAISPGSSVAKKEWFSDRYAEVADRLVADGVDVILVGSASERETIDRVLRYARSRPVDLSGRTRIGQLAAVLEKCDLVISNDTGPMHLAVSVGTPVAAIFGPTDPRIYGPYRSDSIAFWEQLPCGPCGHKPTCEHRDCLQSITVDRVYGAAAELLAGRGGLKR